MAIRHLQTVMILQVLPIVFRLFKHLTIHFPSFAWRFALEPFESSDLKGCKGMDGTKMD